MTELIARIAQADRFVHGPSLSTALRDLAQSEPDRRYLRDQGRPVTVGQLDRRVDETVRWLQRIGVTASSRVALALPVSGDHVVLIFALLRAGALWVPVNTQLIGEPLDHQLRDSGATHIIAEATGEAGGFSAQLHTRGEVREEAVPGLEGGAFSVTVLPGPGGEGAGLMGADAGAGAGECSNADTADRHDACLLMYTSGTTGPPKGALVSETMLKAAVLGAFEVTDPRPGDVFYVWEPLFHIGGAQVVFLPLFREVSLALAPRFSASRFWHDIVAYDVTHIHYLGGVLQILLQLPPSPAENDNHVRVAWGAGATPEVRAACAERFGFALHECYGMTEASSIVAVNRNETDGGVGRPLPWVEIAIDSSVTGNADRVDRGQGDTGSQIGEVCVRGRVEGLLTAGYLGNPAASAKARDGAWFRTGDLGYLDDRGRLHFTGRGSDSIRVRGENVSAWQVESVFGLHPAIDRCAVVGVAAEIGEQEMMLVFTAANGSADPAAVLDWGIERLPRFQVPRYARIVDEMPLTPSQRVAKHRLPRDTAGAAQLPRRR